MAFAQVYCGESSSESENFELEGEEEQEFFLSGIEPYRFEPEWSSDDERTEQRINQEWQNVDEESRRKALDWCTCGNCIIMDTNEECKCCREIAEMKAKNEEAINSKEVEEVPICITQHPGFEPVCLNTWVLQTAWYQFKQQYREAYEGPEDQLYRHIAYRQLARWCWGILGKEIRVVLPSCAVKCIRERFPPPGPADEFQFEGFHHADE